MRNYHYQMKKLIQFTLLVSIVFILTFTELGYPRFGLINSTIIHLPIFFGIIYFQNFKYSLALGFVWGLSSFLKVWLTPSSPLDPIFLNPIVSILPRLIMGIIAHFWLINNQWLKQTINLFVLTLIHSILVLGAMFLIYNDFISQIIKTSTWNFILTIFFSSSLVEGLLSATIVPQMILAFRKDHKWS